MGWLYSDHTLKSPSIIYFLVVQLVAALVALYEMYDSRFELDLCRNFYSGSFISLFEHIGLCFSFSFTSLYSPIISLGKIGYSQSNIKSSYFPM